MKKRQKNILKGLIALGFSLIFIIIHAIIVIVIKNNEKNYYNNESNIIELNYDGNRNFYKNNIHVSDNSIKIQLQNGDTKNFYNKKLKYGFNSFRNQEIHYINLIINNYALINMHFASMFNTIFLNLDDGTFIDNIPACKNIKDKNFNKEKNMFFCYNYDNTKFSENGISVFLFKNKKMNILYDAEEYLKYTDVKWISKDTIQVNYIKNKKIGHYTLKCNENSCKKY